MAFDCDINYQIPQETKLREWLSSIPKIVELYDNFSIKLERREILSAYEVALQTLRLLLKIFDKSPIKDLSEFTDKLRLLGYCLLKKQPMALSIGSVVLRFIKMLEDQSLYYSNMYSTRLDGRLSGVLSARIDHNEVYDSITDKKDFNALVHEFITEELEDDIQNASNYIMEYAKKYINDGDIVLTYSNSYAVSHFLQEANGENNRIRVICCETFPVLSGQQFILDLAKKGIDSYLIHDAAAYSMMSLCSKVVIGCHAILANGGILVPSGGSNIVMAAKQFKVPVIVLSGLYKLIPQFCSDQNAINDMNSPNQVLPYSMCDNQLKEIDVINPVYDYIPPEYIDLILTTKGGYDPSCIFRVMKDYYPNKDILQPLILRFDNTN